MRTEIASRLPKSSTLRLSGQLSLVALLAGLGAGCTGSAFSLKEPVFTGSTANQQAILSGQGGASGPSGYTAPTTGYMGGPGAGVQSNDLPPPPGANATAYAGGAAPAPQAYTPPKPYAASGLPTPVGQVSPAAPTASPPGQTLAQLGAAPTSLNQQAARIDGRGRGGSHTVQSG